MEWIRGMGRAKVEMEFLRLSCGNSYLRSSVLCGGGPFDGTKYSTVLLPSTVPRVHSIGIRGTLPRIGPVGVGKVSSLCHRC